MPFWGTNWEVFAPFTTSSRRVHECVPISVHIDTNCVVPTLARYNNQLLVMLDEVLRCPKTEEEWKEVAANSAPDGTTTTVWGTVEGKHIAMKMPHSDGSYYYNYRASTALY